MRVTNQRDGLTYDVTVKRDGRVLFTSSEHAYMHSMGTVHKTPDGLWLASAAGHGFSALYQLRKHALRALLDRSLFLASKAG